MVIRKSCSRSGTVLSTNPFGMSTTRVHNSLRLQQRCRDGPAVTAEAGSHPSFQAWPRAQLCNFLASGRSGDSISPCCRAKLETGSNRVGHCAYAWSCSFCRQVWLIHHTVRKFNGVCIKCTAMVTYILSAWWNTLFLM